MPCMHWAILRTSYRKFDETDSLYIIDSWSKDSFHIDHHHSEASRMEVWRVNEWRLWTGSILQWLRRRSSSLTLPTSFLIHWFRCGRCQVRHQLGLPVQRRGVRPQNWQDRQEGQHGHFLHLLHPDQKCSSQGQGVDRSLEGRRASHSGLLAKACSLLIKSTKLLTYHQSLIVLFIV